MPTTRLPTTPTSSSKRPVSSSSKAWTATTNAVAKLQSSASQPPPAKTHKAPQMQIPPAPRKPPKPPPTAEQQEVLDRLHRMPELAPSLKPLLAPADFVLVMASYQERLPLVRLHRNWTRGGVRSMIAVDVQGEQLDELNRDGQRYNETYVYYKDGGVHTGGDYRAFMAPFLAHQLLAEGGVRYKWMLYGDDDTIWNFKALTHRLLPDYDSSLPYVISDGLTMDVCDPEGRCDPLFPEMSAVSPRCLPCHMAQKPAAHLQQWLNSSIPPHNVPRFMPAAGCPCTPQVACSGALEVLKADPKGTGKSMHQLCADIPNVGEARRSGQGLLIYGGPGMVMSRGLFVSDPRRRSPEYLEGWMERTKRAQKDAHSGDGWLSAFLWAHGVAPTDPGLLLPQRYAASQLVALGFRDYRLPRVPTAFGGQNLWQPAKCSSSRGACAEAKRGAVLSVHLKAGQIKSVRQAVKRGAAVLQDFEEAWEGVAA